MTTQLELSKVLFSSELKALNRFCRSVFKITAEAELTPQQFVLVALYDWFQHFSLFSDLQLNEIICFLQDRILQQPNDAEMRASLTATQVVLSTYRYVSITLKDSFFDAQDGVELPELPIPAVTHFVCDVTALYDVLQCRLAKISAGTSNAGNNQPSGGKDCRG